MSLRQIRRAKEVAGIKSDVIGTGSGSSSGSDVPVIVKKSAFSMLRDDSSSSSSDEEAPGPVPVGVSPIVHVPKAVVPSRRRVKKAAVVPEIEKQKIQSVLDPSVKIDPRFLNPSSELRRILGRSGAASSSRGIPRRHWLIEPEKEWPMVVRDVFRMEICSDGSYRLVPESDYEIQLATLARIVLTHDLDALTQFVHFRPFHPHGLIQLATVLIEQRGEFENAYILIRRALFAFQSGFLPSFHPKHSSLLLSIDSLFSSSLLRALLLYAHLLAGQGCVRTALEVHKLIYQLEGGMGSGCPLTHILLHIDITALQSGQTEWLGKFLGSTGLAESLPSAALSHAIVTRKDPALVQAIVRFPSLFKAILGRVIDVPEKPDLLVNKLVLLADKLIAWVKRDSELCNWIEEVVIKTESKKLSRPTHFTLSQWVVSGYSNIRSSEMEWGKASKGFVEPEGLMEVESQVLNIYSEEHVDEIIANSSMLDHAVSLESNPVVAFLGSLLPWSRVDVAGTEALPITAASVMDRLRAAWSTPDLPEEEESELDMDG